MSFNVVEHRARVIRPKELRMSSAHHYTRISRTKSIFPEFSTQETEGSKNGKGCKGPGGEHIKNYGQQVMSVRTLEGLGRKRMWLVADVRRPLVSASHIIQAGNDLFIGKNEAYIMKKEEEGEIGARRRKAKGMCLTYS